MVYDGYVAGTLQPHYFPHHICLVYLNNSNTHTDMIATKPAENDDRSDLLEYFRPSNTIHADQLLWQHTTQKHTYTYTLNNRYIFDGITSK